ncbi:MAG: DUF3857 domain-containing protein [Bacteroidales bacterium]|nr:DUF3857 domain-containing protein [Bacteroidales bacterium]
MKKTTLALLLTCFSLAATAKVTKADFAPELTDEQRNASAVVLEKKEAVYYKALVSSGLKLMTDIEVKILVLKEDGKSYADISAMYYDKDVISIKAESYNLENDKITSTKADGKYQSKEVVRDDLMQLKVAVPDVRVGTVIEYKIHRETPYLYEVPFISLQGDIPIKHVEAQVDMPEFVGHRLNAQGYTRVLSSKEESKFRIPGGTGDIKMDVYKFAANNVPALEGDDWVYCINDYTTGIDYEISAIKLGNKWADYSFSWSNVNAALKDSEFGKAAKMSNPLAQEVAAIKSATSDTLQQVAQVLKLVQDKFTWNDRYRLLPSGVKDAIAKGSGNSADKNFLLAAALRDLGLPTTLVLMNPRSKGRLPLNQATIEKISAFVVITTLPNGKKVYLDASDPYSLPNVLSPDMLVELAHTYEADGQGYDVNLSNLTRSVQSQKFDVTVNPADDEITVDYELTGTNQIAYGINKRYKKDPEAYMTKFEKQLDATSLTGYKNDGIGTERVAESCQFTRSVMTSDSLIYVPAFPDPFFKENPFKDPDRKIPVEMPFCAKYMLHSTIHVPEGYTIEEAPQSMTMKGCDGKLTTRMLVDRGDNSITLMLELNVGKMLFPISDMTSLTSFFAKVTEDSNAFVVLKKL